METKDAKITLELKLHKYKEMVYLFGKVKTNILRLGVNPMFKASIIEDVNKIMSTLSKSEKHKKGGG